MRASSVPAWFIIGALTFLVFAPTMHFDFLQYDDHENILNNPLFHPRAVPQIAEIWSKPVLNMYIPVSYTFWAIIVDLARLFAVSDHPAELPSWPFHLANIFLHSLNTILVYRLIRNLTGSPRAAPFGAMLFAFHPLQVESVVWVTGFRDLVSHSLCLAALCIWIDNRRQFSFLRETASLALFALALLSKPSAVFLPVAMIVVAVSMRFPATKRTVVPIGIALALSAAIAQVTRSIQSELLTDIETGFVARILTALDAIVFYLIKCIFPFRLVPDYGRTPDFVLHLDPLVHLTHFLVIGTLVVLWFRMKSRTIRSGMLFWMTGLFPVLGLIPFGFQFYSTVADRYAYIALVGVGMIGSEMMIRFDGRRTRQIMTTICVLLAVRTLDQSMHWSTTKDLFLYTVRIRPDSFLATISLGEYFGRVEKDYAKAREYYSKAVMLRKNEIESQNELGNVLMELEQYAEALQHFRIAHTENPSNWQTLNNMANAYYKLGSYEESLAVATQASTINPSSWQIHMTSANTLKAMGRLEEALEHYQRASVLNPRSWEVANNFGNALLNAGRHDEAIEQYRKVLAIEPDSWTAQGNLGQALLMSHRYEEARQALLRAVNQNPELSNAWLNLGYANVQLKRDEESLTAFQRAVELAPDLLIARLNLINALSANGRYREAIAEIDRVRDRAPELAAQGSELMRMREELEQSSRMDREKK